MGALSLKVAYFPLLVLLVMMRDDEMPTKGDGMR